MRRTPQAARDQRGANGADLALVQAAQQERPQRRWWWGRRNWSRIGVNEYDFGAAGKWAGMPQVERQHGAWCYLCHAPIVTWSSRWPMTKRARAAIAAHRRDHIQGRLDLPTPAEEHER